MLGKKILTTAKKYHIRIFLIRTFVIRKFLIRTFRSIACLLFFGSILTAQATSFESNVPDIGQGGDWVIDTAQERLLGYAMMQKINEAELVTRDNVVNDYLHNLSIRLQAAAPHTDFKLHYFCI